VTRLRPGASRPTAPRHGERRPSQIFQQPDQPQIPASCWLRRTESVSCSPKGLVLFWNGLGRLLGARRLQLHGKIRVVSRPPAAGLLAAHGSPPRGNADQRRSFNSLINRRFTPRAGPGAPSPSPTAKKLPECGGTASGGCSVRGAFSRTERSALDQAVKGSALICVLIRRGAISREEPSRGESLTTRSRNTERSAAEAGCLTRSGTEVGALSSRSP
jgi:hypothetical protein